MGRLSQLGWYGLLAACALLVHSHPEVEFNPLVERLGEAGGNSPPAVFTEDTKGKLPPGTQVLRHINNVESHHCRFECYDEEMCSAFQWTGSTNECILYQAPNHLRSPAANAAWHLAASEQTGVPYEMDEAQKAMIAAAKKMAEEAKEDERRGKLTIDDNLKEEITALQKRSSDRVKETTDPEALKVLSLDTSFQISEMKKFVSKHRQDFQAEMTRQIDFYAREEAKAELRSDASMAELKKSGFKDLDQKINSLTDEMKSVVKGKIARVQTRAFLKAMKADVLKKLTAFKEETILNKEKNAEKEAAKEQTKKTEQKKKQDLAAKTKKIEKSQDTAELVKYAVKEQKQKKDRKAMQDKKAKAGGKGKQVKGSKKGKQIEAEPVSDNKKATQVQKEIKQEEKNAKKETENAETAATKSRKLKQESKAAAKQAQKASDATEKKALSKKAGKAERGALALAKKAKQAQKAAAKGKAKAKAKLGALKKLTRRKGKRGKGLKKLLFFEKV